LAKAVTFDAVQFRDNHKLITQYLNDAFETSDVDVITKAIGDMLRAQGMSRISKMVGLRREGLYRSFGGQTGPGFDTVMKVLRALNIRIVAQPVAGGGGLKKGK